MNWRPHGHFVRTLACGSASPPANRSTDSRAGRWNAICDRCHICLVQTWSCRVFYRRTTSKMEKWRKWAFWAFPLVCGIASGTHRFEICGFFSGRKQFDVRSTAFLSVLQLNFVLHDQRFIGEHERFYQTWCDRSMLCFALQHQTQIVSQNLLLGRFDRPNAIVFSARIIVFLRCRSNPLFFECFGIVEMFGKMVFSRLYVWTLIIDLRIAVIERPRILLMQTKIVSIAVSFNNSSWAYAKLTIFSSSTVIPSSSSSLAPSATIAAAPTPRSSRQICQRFISESEINFKSYHKQPTEPFIFFPTRIVTIKRAECARVIHILFTHTQFSR